MVRSKHSSFTLFCKDNYLLFRKIFEQPYSRRIKRSQTITMTVLAIPHPA